MKTITLKCSKNALLLIGFLLCSIIGYSQTTQVYNASGTFIVPAGVTTLQVEAWGAGGAGGGNPTNADGGGGGGGGAYSKITGFGVTAGAMHTVTVGTGGAGSTGDGLDGGSSTFSSTLTLNAAGGEGGSAPVAGSGGISGNGGSSALSVGTTKFSGGNGGTGRNNNTGQGGPGGSSGGNAANGTSGAVTWSTVTSGVAPAGGGKGGNGGTNGNVGNVGAVPGAGGGGAGDGNQAGGNGANGRVTVTLTCPAYALTAATTATGPFCGASSSVVTMRSSSMPTGTYTVTYNLTGATGLIGNTATVNFTAGTPGTGTFTTPALNPGTTNITITNIASGTSCNSAVITNNTASVFEVIAPTVNAGTAITTCATSGAINITAGATASNYTTVAWTSSGTGTFVNPFSLSGCTYNPSAADITAGNVTLTLTANATAPCVAITSTKVLTINSLPTAIAGAAMSVCYSGAPINVTAGSSAANYTAVLWTSSGTGTFSNASSLTTCTYTPSAADITAGSVTLTLTASNPGCSNAVDTKVLSVSNPSTAIAGPAMTTCSSGATNITAGSSATNYTSITWTSSGTGTFANAASLTTCTYTPSAADITSGSVILTLTATSACGSATNTKTLTINQAPVAAAGTPITTCFSAGAVNITAGSSAANYTTVTWTSSGSGTFANATSLTTCTYNPSAADRTAGSVTLTLTATRAGCPNATSTKVLTIISGATAVAGTNINTCATAGAINITAGSSAANYTSLTWTSSGSGTFANATSLTTCTYTPTAADISAGNVTLTLTAADPGCANGTSTKTLTINGIATSTAGTAIITCTTSGAVNITAGSSATNYASIAWTSSGSGTFANANSLTTCTYNPSALDIIAGSVTLTLTANGNAPCGNVTSTKTLTIRTPMVVSAGTAVTTCATTASVNITAGSSAVNQTSVAWTSSGSGTFANANSLTTCTYTPSAADKTAGSVTLTLTATNGGCANVTSTKTLTITPAPIANAGTPIATCNTSGAVNITAGSSASNQSSVTWTSSGTGTFTNANSLTTCTYNPSAADITAGGVTLTLTAVGTAPCGNTTATKLLTISNAMTAIAGSNVTICSTTSTVNVSTGASATNQTSVAWTSSGTGTFTNPTSLATCSYSPSAADIASGIVTITLTASNAGCANAVSSKTITIFRSPTAVAGPAMTACTASGATNITAGSSAAYQTSVTWTSSGTGTFANANSLTTCTYTPSAADISAGSVVLTLTAFGSAPCGNVTSTKTLTVTTSASVTGTTPGSRTGAGTVLLGATASLGTLNWYAALTGGTALGTGTSFTTPVISTTTTFYVEAVNGACSSSPRTPVIATVNYTEIDIQGNATSIVSGDLTPSTSDWTDFGTTNPTRTFTIRNIGASLLTVGAVSISGTNAGDFTITTAPASAVGVGSTATFVVTFAPTAVGVRTAAISIANNDADENPYTFAIQATGVEQEIDIKGNATTIVNGDMTPSTSDWTDFSTVAGTRTFTIENFGNIALNITAINISGVNAADFTVTTAPAATVGPNGSTTFVVTFNPSAINTRTATISVVNNDNTENPYVFGVQGFGIIPELDIQGNATSIPDSTVPAPTTANWTDFSSTAGTRTFTIYNNGNIALTLGAITFTGANASEFTVTTAPASTVAAFSSTTFVVTFLPTAVGTRSAVIHIVNNDSNENPYDFNLQGTGVPREIDLQGLGLSIASGDMVTSVNDGTDLGSADTNFGLVTRTFTIRNTGSLSLTISNPTISGANASEFSITANPGTLTILAGSSTTFQVTFNPSAVFTRIAQINIINNDSDENPYYFAIQGTGFLDSDGDGVDNNTDQDDDNDGIIDTIECGTCISDPFVNGSFEAPVIGATTYSIEPAANVTGWNNSAESFIEIWSTGFLGVPSAAGNQFAELNANVAGNLYQTFCLNGAGGTINWAIKHRGRSGTDVAAVRFGATLGTIATVATMTDGTTSWGSYSGTYSIPVGQTSIVLAFTAVSSTGGLSYGNFIDDVQIIINQNCIDTDSDLIADIVDVDDENDGIPSIEEAGFKTYSNGKSTMDKTSALTWVDANANGLNDYIDSRISAGTYLIPDTDGDGIKDHLDLDSDNDTAFDVDESGTLNGDGDITGDGNGDGLDADGDGLLNLYDNATVFGSTPRIYAQDSDANGIADYLQLDSNDDGVNDIQAGLYGSFDTNGDGRIDGSGDSDADGILNIFDTNDILRGSPRDLDRKLYLDFDGRNDYGQEPVSLLGGLSSGALMAWIDLNSAFSSDGVIVGQDQFRIGITSSKTLQAYVGGTTITFATPLATSRWYHVAVVYTGSLVKLYLNGLMVNSASLSGALPADASLLTVGKSPTSNAQYFKGKIDEVRIFNTSLSDDQVQRMVYQEIKNNSAQVRGEIVPKDVGALPYANVLRYFRMDAYKDDIIDNYTSAAIDLTGMKIYNNKIIYYQQAPMPFITKRTGSFATAVDDVPNDVRGMDIMDQDWSIVQVKHDITEPFNNTELGMFVDPGVTITMSNDNKIENSWYLKLDGKIDLVGKSQLVQTVNSDLDVTSAGSIERDQKGQTNKFNYNYWTSPVGALSTTANNTGFTLNGVMRDATNPSAIQPINWVAGYNGSPTSPVSLSNYWIFKFQNVTPQYANWTSVGPNGTLLAAQGFTLKGSGAATATQNYTFVGKPNNGTITSPIAGGNANLSGNPYASAIDANKFINDNAASTTGTLYFWEHFPTNSSHNLLDYQGGYAARNLTGGTPPVSPSGISGLGSSTRTPGRYIPVGQGFLIYGSAAGGNIVFNNSQRTFVREDNASSNVMFRTQSGPLSVLNNDEDPIESDEFERVRIGFNSANGFHRQILLGFMDGLATPGFDEGYDALNIDTQPSDMSFKADTLKLLIQGDGTFNNENIYPLYISTGEEGDFSFTLDGTENFDENQDIYIYDSVTDTYNDIRNEAFHVNLTIANLDNRFSLRFKNATQLATTNPEVRNEVSISFTNNDNMLNITNKPDGVDIISVELFNVLGQTIESWNVESQNQDKIQIPVRNVSTGTYIVKVHTSKGDVSKKIIIR